MNNNNQSRREFLTRCAALGAAGIASPLASLGLMSSATAAATPPTQYRAMVCVYLIGGNDLNMLVPTDADNFGLYTNLRQKIALKQESLLAIESSQGGTSQSFGLHPACTGMQELYNKGNLAFVNNTGALIEPTTAEQFKTKSVKVPPKIFSHNSQKDFVQAGLPFAGEKLTGWAGRIADMYQSSGLTATMNFSFTGDNVWQRGETTKAYGMRGSKVIPAFSFRNNAGTNIASRKSILERINNLQSDHLITSEYGRIVKESINLSDGLREGAQVQEIELQTRNLKKIK